jgi:hypothetical protein
MSSRDKSVNVGSSKVIFYLGNFRYCRFYVIVVVIIFAVVVVVVKEKWNIFYTKNFGETTGKKVFVTS